jgi:hypothetical protein
MTRPRARVLLASLLALGIAASAVTASASVAGPRQATTTGMYGHRYCEYLVVKGTLPNLTARVWNTYGLSDCPERLWRKSDTGAMAKQLHALTVVLNGPRYWLMNSTRITLPAGFGQIQKFSSGLRARLVATLDVPIHNGTPGNTPYSDVTVNRTNTFTWSHRHPVYELVSPRGRLYVMQSYSQIIDPHLKLADLSALGARLHLPAGWRFRKRALKHDLTLTARGRVTVIQDDLANTYQLAPR